MERGTPLLSALEDFYADSIDRVAAHLQSELAVLTDRDAALEQKLDDLRCAEFLGLYLDQIQSVPPETWIAELDLERGALRASMVGRELAAAAGQRRRSLLIDGQHLGSDHLPLMGLPPSHLKAAMCYAHDLVVEDPFDEEQVIGDFLASVIDGMPHVPVRVAPDPEHFVESVAAIAALAPAIRAGHVTFVPRRLAMDTRLAGQFVSNAWQVADLRRVELARRSLRLWLATGGLVTPLFGSLDEERAFVEESGLLHPLVIGSETTRLQRIATLVLPAAGNLQVEQMVTLREDDAFEEFRSRERAGLAAVGTGTDTEDVELFRQEMATAAKSLRASVDGHRSVRSWVAEAAGWSVGAAILRPDSWQEAVAAVGAMTTRVVAEQLLDKAPPGNRALYHHYATLGGLH